MRIQRSLFAATVVAAILTPFGSWAETTTGSYVGNAQDGRQVDVGFAPVVVVVRAATPQAAFIRTSCMPPGASKPMSGARATVGSGIKSFNGTGFTVGLDAGVNEQGVTYHWAAMTEDTYLGCGHYDGSGAVRTITGLSFAPRLVFVLPSGTRDPSWRTYYMVNDANVLAHVDKTHYGNDAGMPSNLITSMTNEGFGLGSDSRVNAAGERFDFFAVGVAAQFVQTWYRGTGTTTTQSSGSVTAQFLFLQNVDGTGDSALRFAGSPEVFPTAPAAAVPNCITSVDPTSWTYGTNSTCNGNGSLFHIAAFGGPPPLPPSDPGPGESPGPGGSSGPNDGRLGPAGDTGCSGGSAGLPALLAVSALVPLVGIRRSRRR
jgi:hypothetical protein